MMARPQLRSLLFVPGDDERKLRGAADRGADAVVVDLEDAVAETQKDAALAAARVALAAAPAFVRVNGLHSGRLETDLSELASTGLLGIVLPKVESAGDVRAVVRLLARLERERGLSTSSIPVLPIIETARGIQCAGEIAACQCVQGLIFGSVDFARDAQVDPGPDGAELLYARSRLIVAARAARLSRILDGPYMSLDDLDGLTADVERSRRAGFTGRVVLHPAQVEPVNDGYRRRDVAYLRRLVAAFESEQLVGRAALRFEGTFVDYASYRAAKTQLDLAALGGRL